MRYLREVRASHTQAEWLVELLCLRMPTEVLEHHMLPAYIRSFDEREIFIGQGWQQLKLYSVSRRSYLSSPNAAGPNSSITTVLHTMVVQQILPRLINAAKDPDLAQKLHAQKKDVDQYLVSAMGKALMSHGIVKTRARFQLPLRIPRLLLPAAIHDYTNIIENLELSLSIAHHGTALYNFPAEIVAVSQAAQDIRTLLTHLKTLHITIDELQKHPPVKYTLQRPMFQNHNLLFVPEGMPETKWDQIMQNLATNMSNIKALEETTLLCIQDKRDVVNPMRDWPTIRTLWRNGVKV